MRFTSGTVVALLALPLISTVSNAKRLQAQARPQEEDPVMTLPKQALLEESDNTHNHRRTLEGVTRLFGQKKEKRIVGKFKHNISFTRVET